MKIQVTEPDGRTTDISCTYHTLTFAETLAELDPFQKHATAKADLRFFWNGIKVGKGKLQRVFYSGGEYLNHPSGTIAIYAREHTPFSPEIRAAFTVKNDSDGMIDYFETDSIKVHPDHPLYQKVKDALDARNAHYA